MRPARALSIETRDLIGNDRREAAERILGKPALAPQAVDEADGDRESELEAEGTSRDG